LKIGLLVGEDGVGLHDVVDLGADGGDEGLVRGVVEDAFDELVGTARRLYC